jgi:hypothetical protein
MLSGRINSNNSRGIENDGEDSSEGEEGSGKAGTGEEACGEEACKEAGGLVPYSRLSARRSALGLRGGGSERAKSMTGGFDNASGFLLPR